jgi:ABC-type nitrate/sulfonate/bicarbonate transport system ATPase subunit
VLADGQPVQRPGRERLVMFQESALFPWLDAFGNVMFGLKLRPEFANRDRREIAYRFLNLVGLEKFAHAPIHELSGGMKQRVALARALAPDPQVLLMDEPFGALDAMTRDQLYEDIQQIWKKSRKTVVFVTHNVREAVCLGDRVILMSPSPGRILQGIRYPPLPPARHEQCRARDPCGADRRRRCAEEQARRPNEARAPRHAVLPRAAGAVGARRVERPLVAGAAPLAASCRRVSHRCAAGRNADRGDLGHDAAAARRLRDRRRARTAARARGELVAADEGHARRARARAADLAERVLGAARAACGSARARARCCSSS